MRIALGSDHRGVGLKRRIFCYLLDVGEQCHDFGAYDETPVDYPDIAKEVGESVSCGEFERGILICGTGVGMSMASNKISGIRAALCGDVFVATRARQHNDANVLVLGAEVVPPEKALEIVTAFMGTPFEGGRHLRRIEKLAVLDIR